MGGRVAARHDSGEGVARISAKVAVSRARALPDISVSCLVQFHRTSIVTSLEPPRREVRRSLVPRTVAGWRSGERSLRAGLLSEAPSRSGIWVRERRYRRALGYADAIAAYAALYVAVVLLGDDSLRLTSVLVMPIVVVVSKLMGLYDRDEVLLNKTTLDECPALFQLASLYALVTWLLESVLIDGYLGNRQVLGLWVLLFAFALVARAVARQVARWSTSAERCLLVGPAAELSELAHRMHQGGQKATVVGHLSFHSQSHRDTMRELERRIISDDVHRVILAPGESETDDVLDVVSLVKGLGVRMSFLPRVFEVVGSSVEFDTLNGITVLGVRRFGLGRSSLAIKRTTDLFGAAIGLLAIGPIMLAIALAVRLASHGPILFRQVRVGRDGKPFTMLKFRTMVDGAEAMKRQLAGRNEAEGLFKIATDPRITRVGRLLRRTSLDELPQLINVLRGEMSLVGPRPLVVDEDCKVEGRHRRRLQLTPGMTGPWQILGSARIPLDQMVKIDYLYVANWSFWGDVKILARTVVYMLRGRGM
jgi:exopolysaccharide biosynthesis polyprenyl glycosylphosphotransferase